MLLTIIIAGALFAGMLGILAFGYQQIEQERNEKADAVLANAPAAQPGRCMLCNAPLRRSSTADEVVYEVERRIDAELQDVIRLLGRPAPEGLARLYQA
jgi:hypothetical protein